MHLLSRGLNSASSFHSIINILNLFNILYNNLMQTKTITWNHPCYYCHRPILRGRPTLLFSTDEPLFIGVSHSTCCSTKLKYGHFQTCPPNRLTSDQVSFIGHFYPMLYKLLGGESPNRELRYSLARLLYEYPSSVKKPMPVLQRFFKEHNDWGFKVAV
jgi:hypothetical protein